MYTPLYFKLNKIKGGRLTCTGMLVNPGKRQKGQIAENFPYNNNTE